MVPLSLVKMALVEVKLVSFIGVGGVEVCLHAYVGKGWGLII